MIESKKPSLFNLTTRESDMLEEIAYKTRRNKTETVKMAIELLYNNMKNSNTI